MIVTISKRLVADLARKAGAAPRLRTNHNFHPSYDDPVQRLLNAAQPGTYIRPHKHENPDKPEIFIILTGSVVIVEFGDDGRVAGHVVLDRDTGAFGVEIPPRTWHTFITLKADSVLFEVKQGPFRQISDKNFASWAPAEGAAGAPEFNARILKELELV